MVIATMTHAVYDILDAYRADLANASGDEPAPAAFGTRDEIWIVLGTALQRALALPRATRDAYLEAALVDLMPSTGTLAASRGATPDRLAAAVAEISEEAEDAGAYAMANTLLDLGRLLVPLDAVRLQGRLLARQARVQRKLGELDESVATYDRVEEAGRDHDDDELICRAQLGKGIVARVRGNYPAARAHFQRVLDSPGPSAEIDECRSLAHAGLMRSEERR